MLGELENPTRLLQTSADTPYSRYVWWQNRQE